MWDNETVSEYELISEDAEKAEQAAAEYSAQTVVAEASEDVLEEIIEESAFELDKKESNIVYNARLRLEQAKLYEMLINHNLFEGVDASPEAISNVQNELKFYIVKRLEILLGLREPVVRTEVAVATLPFNDIEIDFLKQLAYKGTLGASITGKAVSPEIEKKQVVKPLTSMIQPNKPKALKPLKKTVHMAPEEQQVVADKKVVKTTQVAAKNTPPVVKKAPVKTTAPKIRESGLGREMTEKEAEILAKEDLIKNPPKKPFHELNAKQKAERIREVNEKHKRPTSTGRVLSMPTSQELEMKYMNQQANRSLSKSSTDQFNIILANALAVRKNKGEEENE